LSHGTDIAVDSNGNNSITGYFRGSATFGTTTLNSGIFEHSIFVAKLDTNGDWQWAKRAGGTDDDFGRGICVDSNENVYITGQFEGTATFGSLTPLTSPGNNEVFIAKLDTNGVWQWAERAGGTSSDIGMGICADPNNYIYAIGYFAGKANFGTSPYSLTSIGGYDIFVTKLDTNGDWQWAKRAGGTDNELGLGICTDSNGNSYITGSFIGSADFGPYNPLYYQEKDIFVTKLDTNGNWQWAESAGGNYTDIGWNLCVDLNENVYLTGHFEAIAYFGTLPYLQSDGYWDIFVAKIGCDGNQPPNPPTITGQMVGFLGRSYIYNFVSTDPDGDPVSYYIDWGNGISPWTFPFIPEGPPGYDEAHSWSNGIYIIKAKAKDTCGLESAWSQKYIFVFKDKTISINSLFQRFLQKHPNMFPILRQLIEFH
jgi:hypothetical protein